MVHGAGSIPVMATASKSEAKQTKDIQMETKDLANMLRTMPARIAAVEAKKKRALVKYEKTVQEADDRLQALYEEREQLLKLQAENK